MPAWINEFHYDNASTDSGEFIEVAATAGTDLTGWTIIRYNGSNSLPYTSPGTIPTFSGVVADQTGTGFGFLKVDLPQDGLQNGGAGTATQADGFALVDNAGHVVQFLSYEGQITAAGTVSAANPAAGMTSTNIGVAEDGNGAVGTSLQLQGTGGAYADFHWNATDIASTEGAVNTGQTLVAAGSPPPPPAGTVSVANVTQAEGNSDHTIAVTVTRTDTTSAFTVDYATHDGTATTADHDYDGATGTLTFAAGGPASQVINLTVHGDTNVEPDEAFSLTLGNVQSSVGSTNLGTATSTVTLANDDVAASPPPPPPIAGPVFINEFHYDNASTDTGEFIEIAAPIGADLGGYKLELYDGNGSKLYNTIALTGSAGAGQNGEGVATFNLPVNGLQNGGTATAPQSDGIALVDPQGHVVEFISYEGTLTPTNGDAAGMTSTDVGVFEDGLSTGTSIARVGPGVDASDFSWRLTPTNGATPGAVNTGETFLASSPRIHISDASVTEGDDGQTTMTFTVSRTGTADAFNVDYATADGTATHGSDYVSTSGTLNFAAGQASATISVAVNGDTTLEGNETLSVNLSNATNGAAIIDSQGVGTIVNDDVALVHTYDIQGAGHTSPLNGQHVFTEGVVTAIDTTGAKGFWIQDPTGDGNDATSDAVFVFTGTTPTVEVGHLVKVEGDVDEFQGSDPNNLTITEVNTDAAHVTDEGVGPAIAPTIIGDGGRHAPTEVIDSDNFTVFNPDHDAADFYESLEGMLVTVKNAQVTTASFSGETFVVPDDGLSATGMNDRGGITISAGDMNPEAIELFNDTGVANIPLNNVAGDHLGDVSGVVSYFGGNYELITTAVQSTATAGAASRETTTLSGDASHLTIGEYNLDNLDPSAGARFDALASDIVHNLGSPNIIGVEEISDDTAAVAAGSTDLSGTATLQKLVDSIAAAGGPHYAFAEIAPTVNGANGGAPSGNIRQAFLYDPSKVTLVDGSLRQIQDDNPANGDAYSTSRHPLVGDFVFNGETVTVVDLHDSARSGSDEQFGVDQPPVNSDDQKRTDQTAPVEHFVQQQEAANPNAQIIVTGDFNGFQFETAQTQLTTNGILTNLDTLLNATDRYSYNFDGDDEEIDHMYASPSLAGSAQFDIVHLNTGQSDASRDTDHDPTIGRFLVDAAPTAVNDSASANDHQSVTINVTANDTDPNPSDTETVVSVSATTAGGHASLVNGQVVYTADADAFDSLTPGQHATDTFTYVIQDLGGETSSATVTVTVDGVANGPTQTGGATNDSLTGTTANDSINGGAGNDTVDAGSGADSVTGGTGNDVMLGGAGADVLNGGTGRDLMTGGAGADHFVYSLTADSTVALTGQDEILDFNSAEGDRIDLKALGVHTAGGLKFVSAFTHTLGQMISVDQHNGTYLVEADVNGDGNADFAVLVHAGAPLIASDFILT
jgi:hypothetical protein